jgi:hypothetical protein
MGLVFGFSFFFRFCLSEISRRVLDVCSDKDWNKVRRREVRPAEEILRCFWGELIRVWGMVFFRGDGMEMVRQAGRLLTGWLGGK